MITNVREILNRRRYDPDDLSLFSDREILEDYINESLTRGCGITEPLTNGKGKYVQAIRYPGKEIIYNLYDDYTDHCVKTTSYPDSAYLWLGI